MLMNRLSRKNSLPHFKLTMALWVVFLSVGCARTISTNNLDRAVQSMVKEFEKRLPSGEPVPVVAIGFRDLEGAKPESGDLPIEATFNHFLSRSGKFRVLELNPDIRKRILKILIPKDRLWYQEDRLPELGRFIQAKYLVTGLIQRKDDVLTIRARLVSVETAEILFSAKGELHYEVPAHVYITWGSVILGVIGLVIWMRRRQRPGGSHQAVTRDAFSETVCGACGGAIGNRYQIGGTCMTPTCDAKICKDCWNGERVRHCKSCGES